MDREDMIARICRGSPQAGLPEFLSGLPATDLQTLLLEVYSRRAQALQPADVLRQYRSNRFTKPSAVSPEALHRIDLAAYSLLSPLYTPIELSPLSPFASASALGPVHQNNVVTTARNTEACPDLTNLMALECAVRRDGLLKKDPHSLECVRLCASLRQVRAQMFAGPASFAHFSVFGLCTAGHDEGNLRFEERALREHAGFYLALLDRLDGDGFRFCGHELEIVVYDPACRELAERVAKDLGGAVITAEHKLPYYRSVGLHLYAIDSKGEKLFLADGGFTDWTAKLLSNGKERLMTSGIGTERLAYCFKNVFWMVRGMNVRMIRASEGDAATVGRVTAASWKAAYKGFIPDDYLATITPEVHAERDRKVLAERPDVEFYLAFVNDIPAGVLNLHPCADEDANGCGEIGIFYFLPEYWGKGCATPAMEYALNRLRERGFPAAVLWVFEENVRARRFYEKQGFILDGAMNHMNLGKELTEVRYKRELI